jgi:hypothetical protein
MRRRMFIASKFRSLLQEHLNKLDFSEALRGLRK